MGAQEQAGADRAALETAFLLLARDPLQEGAHRLVMRAYCRLGQRNRALAHYQHCRAVLQQELGAEPEAATRALNEAIRAGSLVSENEAHQRADRT
jgi:DNA-binding SARP family transcriptional activator